MRRYDAEHYFLNYLSTVYLFRCYQNSSPVDLFPMSEPLSPSFWYSLKIRMLLEDYFIFNLEVQNVVCFSMFKIFIHTYSTVMYWEHVHSTPVTWILTIYNLPQWLLILTCFKADKQPFSIFLFDEWMSWYIHVAL